MEEEEEDTFEGIGWTCMKYEDEGRMRILLKESNGLAEWNRGQAIPTCGWAVRHRVPANHILSLAFFGRVNQNTYPKLS